MNTLFSPRSSYLARRIAFTLAVILALLGTGNPLFAKTRLPATPQQNTYRVPDARCTANGNATVSLHNQTGQVRFVGIDSGQTVRATESANAASAELAANAFMAQCGAMFGIENASNNLSVTRERTTEDGRTSVHYQQLYDGVPIFGGELIVNVDAQRNVTSASGEALPNLHVDTQPKIDPSVAKQMALESIARGNGLDISTLSAAEPTLWIYNPILIRPGGGFTQLVWRTEVTSNQQLDIRILVLVNAHRGGVVLDFNQIDTAKNRQTYDANNGTTLPGTLRCNESNPTCSGGDAHEVAAHTYAGDTYDFYMSKHARDSIDNAGLTLISTVHYDSGYANAFWDGGQMVYGDAYGFPLGDDVVAHELTHGVTQYESGLFYYYQSGAINESFSDVWGDLVDQTNGKGTDTAGVKWKMGEDITGLGAIRDMKDPTLFGDPDKMTSANYNEITCGNFSSNCDAGGVHSNSGVNNKAAYLMVDGATFNGKTVTALGVDKTAKIYYEAQRNLLTPGSDYADLYDALYQACQNLIGGGVTTAGDCLEVRDATDAVEMNLQPAAGYNPDAAVCATGAPTTLWFDNLESGAGNWTFGAVAGSSAWSYDGYTFLDFPHSGSHFLYGDDAVYSSNSFAAMNTNVSLPANAYLHFFHAYGFEDPNYDGGILEYSTNNGGSWSNASSMIEVNGYDGTLAGTNPLGAISAYLSDSHGYISTRVNLSSLAGQNVRFRWRLGADNSIYDYGWFLDDVRFYVCNPVGAGPATVTEARTTTKNGTTKKQFTRGEKIYYRADIENTGTADCYVMFTGKASKGGTTLHSFSRLVTVEPGTETVSFKKKIPNSAAYKKYTFTATSDCGGGISSDTFKFKVVP